MKYFIAPELVIIWLDFAEARLFLVSEERMQRETVKAPEAGFFDEVARRLRPATRLALFGPGSAAVSFHNHLINHYPDLAKNVAACEESSQVTDSYIALQAMKYFRRSRAG